MGFMDAMNPMTAREDEKSEPHLLSGPAEDRERDTKGLALNA